MVASTSHMGKAELKSKVEDLVNNLKFNTPIDEESKELLAEGLYKKLPSADLKSLLRTLSGKMPEHDRQEAAQQTVDQLPSVNKADILTHTFKKLPGSQQEPIVKAIAVGPPDTNTTAFVWRTVVGAFSIVFLLTVGALLAKMFLPPPDNPGSVLIKPELILAIVTSATGFLAGLIAPSPVQKR